MHRRFRVVPILTIFAFVFALTACGDDDSGDDLSVDPADETSDPVDDGPVDDDPVVDDDTGDDDPVEAPPEEDSGTITVAGATTELANDDFDICETVNPAFADDYNIIGKLSDGTKFRLSGTLGEEPEDHNGLVLGDTFEEEQASDLDIGRDGRTISGTATVEAGAVEFSFTC